MSAAAKDRAMVDPITVEVISSALSSITEEMGEALVTAYLAAKLRDPEESRALYAVAEARDGEAAYKALRTHISKAFETRLRVDAGELMLR